MIISVTGGKGGVGKTLGSLAMAYHAANAGYRTLLVDADFGLSNIGILLNLDRRHSVEDVLEKTVSLDSAILDSGYGFSVLPSAYAAKFSMAIREKVATDIADTFALMRQLYQVVIVDAGTGIDQSVVTVNSYADHVVLMSSLDPHSITDSYAQLKMMTTQPTPAPKIDLVLARCHTSLEAQKTSESIIAVSRKHIGVTPQYLGHIPEDENLSSAVMSRNIAKMFASNSLAQQAWCQITHKIFHEQLRDNDNTQVRRHPDEGTSQTV